MNLKRRSQRTAPFLHQNWLNGVNALHNSVMGVSLSTPKHLPGHDDGAPPQKRRRLSSPDSLDINRYLGSPEDSLEGRSALRVEVLKVFHKDSKKVRALQAPVVPRDVTTTKGRCRITVSDLSEGFTHILYRSCKRCDIITYKNPVGPHRVARIDLTQPFFVPEESVLVNRQDDKSLDFSDLYKLDVELESTNDGSWPPLDSHDFGIPPNDQGPLSDAAKQHWILHSQFDGVFGRSKNPVRLATGHHPQRPSRTTDYVMDVDLRWTGSRPIPKGSKPCITAIDPDAKPYTTGQLEPIPDDQLNGVSIVNGVDGINGVNGLHDTEIMDVANGVNGANGVVDLGHDDLPHELDDEVDGEQTPNRARRTRQARKPNYNLKLLSDQAQGKDPKKRPRATQTVAAEGRVTYFLPVDQPVCLSFWKCITCGCPNDSLLLLQAHLQHYHPTYDYVLDTASQGPQFRVTHRLEAVGTPTKTYQLGKPMPKPFNLEGYVAGDQSWVTARIGPENNDEPVRSPSKPSTARQLFDNKTGPKPPLPSLPAQPPAVLADVRPKKRKIIIPETAHPLFDPVSKARLVPGEELPKPVVDNSWLVQKHREDIGEFSDVTAAEKEFIRKWDAFILQENITSGAYFGRAWLKFVKEHASWLAAATYRMAEFGKHISVLMVREVLDDKTLDEAMKLIDEARVELKSKKDELTNGTNGTQPTDAALKQSPRASQIVKGSNGCTVCQLPVLGPSLLVCSNKVMCMLI
ncbi:hypothetical protein FALBO_9657 [Fusarium albosuccineum]|uniref:Polycomb protein VEFS-Box domain-containing protein n=1 Tax=Fusarium albosuccineum TaxID=1237068 RepID=A0A8H4PIX5_9HYPO|nr:hypothetical protein FALBO_9657 [Fusarium albosuccineum]